MLSVARGQGSSYHLAGKRTIPCPKGVIVASLLLTRPRASAEEFAIAARWAGKVVISPVLRVTLRNVAAPGADEGVILTSQHGVQALAKVSARRDWQIWCVGPGTLAAARAAGFTDLRMGGGTAQSLRDMLCATPPDCPVVHMRGAHVVADLVSDLTAAGLRARALVCYDQHAQELTKDARAVLMADGQVVVPVFSPRSARLFAQAWRKLDGPQAQLHVVAISAGAADGVSGLPLQTLRVAQTPDMQGMLAALRAMQAALEPEKNPR